jgi:hypothetical protein
MHLPRFLGFLEASSRFRTLLHSVTGAAWYYQQHWWYSDLTLYKDVNVNDMAEMRLCFRRRRFNTLVAEIMQQGLLASGDSCQVSGCCLKVAQLRAADTMVMTNHSYQYGDVCAAPIIIPLPPGTTAKTNVSKNVRMLCWTRCLAG